MKETGARREREGTSMKKAPSPPGLYPWLVYKHGKKDRHQTFCDILASVSGATTRINNSRCIPELRNRTVEACSYGWVVLLDYDDDDEGVHYSLWNPITSESIDLPPLKLKHNQYINYCLLTASPCDPRDCKVLLFGGNFHSIMFCQLSDKQWTEIGYYNQIRSLKVRKDEYLLQWPLICNGKIYAVSYLHSDLLLLELDGSNSLTVSLQTKLPTIQHLHSPREVYKLAESLGEIFYISLNLGGVREKEVLLVEVFKLDLSTMTWAKMTSAKDRAFFLGSNYTISCPTHTSRVEGSRIYFTMEGDKSLYSYNMEDQSILVSLPCLDLPTPYYPRSYWIMPDLNLVNKEPEEKYVVMILSRRVSSIETIEEEAAAKEVGNINLQDLPWLALNGIARNLTLVDYMNFRAVSKVCCSATPPIRWKTELAGSNPQLLSPWLIFPDNNKGIYHLVDSGLNNRCFLTIPESLQDNAIRCSKDGWLLMSKDFNVTLFNPFTKDTIQLPDLSNFGDTSFILTSSPSSPDCIIVGVSVLLRFVGISIICPGETKWDYFEPEIEKPVERTYNSAVFCRGVFYFLNEKGMLEVLKIVEDEVVTWKSLDEPVAPCMSFHQNYLVECDGELLAVFVGKLGESVNIYKLNFSKLVWKKVTSLKNYALYLNRSSASSAVEVKTPEMANRIYFPRFHNQGIVFYSLDTGKFHALGGGEYSLMNYYDTAVQLDCGWIQPSWEKLLS